jgi:hypothetical protein
MKNLLLVVSIAFLGACSNYTTGTSRPECCRDALANGKTCCEDKAATDAKSMAAGVVSTTAAKECSAAGSCDSAAAASCESKAAMSCCDEAKASGKDCADCVKP